MYVREGICLGVFFLLLSGETLIDGTCGGCVFPLRIHLALLYGLISGVSFTSIFVTHKIFLPISRIVMIIQITWLWLLGLAGLPIILLISLNSPNCVSKAKLIASWCVILALNILLLALAIRLIINVVHAYRCKKRFIFAKHEIDLIYTKIFSINIEDYLEQYKEVIDKFELTPREYEIVKDKYSFLVMGIRQEDEDVCAICFAAYQICDRITLHPKCKHEYHYECLIEWLGKCPKCPTCRLPTRSSLLRTFLDQYNKVPGERSKYLLGCSSSKA